jgi:hypothetical protein
VGTEGISSREISGRVFNFSVGGLETILKGFNQWDISGGCGFPSGENI